MRRKSLLLHIIRSLLCWPGSAAATAAGMTVYHEVPNGGHVIGALNGGLTRGFEVLYPGSGSPARPALTDAITDKGPGGRANAPAALTRLRANSPGCRAQRAKSPSKQEPWTGGRGPGEVLIFAGGLRAGFRCAP
jgi:hypothetical protein